MVAIINGWKGRGNPAGASTTVGHHPAPKRVREIVEALSPISASKYLTIFASRPRLEADTSPRLRPHEPVFAATYTKETKGCLKANGRAVALSGTGGAVWTPSWSS